VILGSSPLLLPRWNGVTCDIICPSSPAPLPFFVAGASPLAPLISMLLLLLLLLL